MEKNNVNFEDVVYFQEGPGVRNWQFRDSGIKLINIRNLVDSELCLENTNNYLEIDEVENKYKHFLLNAGDFVMASSGVTWGKIAEVHEEHLPLCLNTSIIRLVSKDTNVLDKWYLYYYIKSPQFRRQIEKLITGSAQPNFGPSHLKKVFINLPSIECQRNSVEQFSKLERIICKRQDELKCLDDLIKARFVELFGDCKTERLGDFCSTHARIGWQKLTRAEFLEEGDYYLITGWDFDVKNREVDFSKCFYVTKERYEQDKKLMLKVGDVLLTKDGTLGKVAMVKKLDKPATLNGHIFVIRSLDGSLIPEFLVGALSSDEFKRQMEANKTGSTIVGVTQKALLEFQLPVAPMELQNQFADFVKQVDKSKVVVQKALDEAQLLFDSLMQQYFG